MIVTINYKLLKFSKILSHDKLFCQTCHHMRQDLSLKYQHLVDYNTIVNIDSVITTKIHCINNLHLLLSEAQVQLIR